MNTDRFILRAWDKNGNPAQMYYDPFIGKPPAHLRLSQIMQELEDDGWVWMKCSGIKDKNKKVIFEGDLLKHSELNDIGVVTFDRGTFLINDETLYYQSPNEFLEIVGNIHENPELLREAE